MRVVKSIQAPVKWSILPNETVRNLALALQYIHTSNLVEVTLKINGVSAQYHLNENDEVVFIPSAHQGKLIQLKSYPADESYPSSPNSSISSTIDISENSLTSEESPVYCDRATSPLSPHPISANYAIPPTYNDRAVSPLSALPVLTDYTTSTLVENRAVSPISTNILFSDCMMPLMDSPVPDFGSDYPILTGNLPTEHLTPEEPPEIYDAIYLSDQSNYSVEDDNMEWVNDVDTSLLNFVDDATFNYMCDDLTKNGVINLLSDDSIVYLSSDEESCIQID